MIANYSTIVGFLCSVIDCLKCILLHYHLIRRYCREFVGNVPTKELYLHTYLSKTFYRYYMDILNKTYVKNLFIN